MIQEFLASSLVLDELQVIEIVQDIVEEVKSDLTLYLDLDQVVSN